MSPDERAAWSQLAAALVGLSIAASQLHEAARSLAWSREDDMPDRRISGVAMFAVGCLFKRNGIPAAVES